MSLMNLTMIRARALDEDENEIELTVPVAVAPQTIRCFYTRKDERPGTRITFVDGGGFAVTETPEAVAERYAVALAA